MLPRGNLRGVVLAKEESESGFLGDKMLQRLRAGSDYGQSSGKAVNLRCLFAHLVIPPREFFQC
jgi:hypothetical protein